MNTTGNDWVSSVLRCTTDAVIVADTAGLVTYINPAACRLTSWTAADAEGRPLTQVLPLIDQQTGLPIERPAAKAMREGHAVELPEHTALITRDGRHIPIEDSTSPVYDPQGTLTGSVIVFRDVTGRRQAEQERQQFLLRLREDDNRKNEFLAMLAHELRNPIAAISTAVQLQRTHPLPHADVEWSKDIIERQIKHLARLIDDLLDVSRITRGKIQLRLERIDATAVINSAVEAVRPLIEEKKQQLVVDFTPDTLWGRVDPTRLDQILINLLTNAAKYTPPGGHIRLSAHHDGTQNTFKIADDGIGISPDELPRLFDLFVQGDRSLARSEGGLGIGLTIARRIAEMHGGTVTAFSEGPGKGSEFTVTLPAADPPRLIATPESPRGHTRLSRILVVDDNVDMARALARLLELIGHEILTAHDGPAAIDAARQGLPDVVLLDIGLPGMDGYQVARRLRQEPGMEDLLLIAITGYGQDEDRRRSLAAGFHHHLVKPVDYHSLVTLLASSPGR